MAASSSLVFAGIAPHPPIMVPEVGREAIFEVRNSIDGMAELTRRIITMGAETVILISPHAPLDSRSFVAYEGPELYGDFANFRAPATATIAKLDEELLDEITRAAADEGLIVMKIRGIDLDHGTAVPLYFLQRNGWEGKVVALGYSFLSNEDHVRFGNCIRIAIEKSGRRVAFVASGDLSHRLKREAPAGYNPDAHLFDEAVVAAIRSNSANRIIDIDQELRRLAGECGYRSMLVAIGAMEGLESAGDVISYEAPFGVGYLVAQLISGSADVSANESVRVSHKPESDDATVSGGGTDVSQAIPSLARLTVENFVLNGKVVSVPNDVSKDLKARAGCFVSIKTFDGDLRGCIGTIEPVKDTLAEEIIINAISAATRDPRFVPVRSDELSSLKYSVDVLSPPESCAVEDLDPQIYGVIVEAESGLHRGLLLPNLPGIDSAAHQVEIARRKAGILHDSRVKLFRFRAERYSEES